MRSACIDTNVIDFCVRENISVDRFKKILIKEKLTPVIPIWVTYELLKNILTDKEKAVKLFLFIKDLDPKFSSPTKILYYQEAKKLRNQAQIYNPFVASSFLSGMKRKIDAYCSGYFSSHDIQFVKEREKNLELQRNLIWNPSEEGKRLRKVHGFDFNTFRSKFITSMPDSLFVFFEKYIDLSSEGMVILKRHEIEKLLSEIHFFPAFRALIFRNIYLSFLTEVNEAILRRDRFTDSYIAIEGSYCQVLLSRDEKFLKMIEKLNPDISPVLFTDLLKNN